MKKLNLRHLSVLCLLAVTLCFGGCGKAEGNVMEDAGRKKEMTENQEHENSLSHEADAVSADESEDKKEVVEPEGSSEVAENDIREDSEETAEKATDEKKAEKASDDKKQSAESVVEDKTKSQKDDNNDGQQNKKNDSEPDRDADKTSQKTDAEKVAEFVAENGGSFENLFNGMYGDTAGVSVSASGTSVVISIDVYEYSSSDYKKQNKSKLDGKIDSMITSKGFVSAVRSIEPAVSDVVVSISGNDGVVVFSKTYK